MDIRPSQKVASVHRRGQLVGFVFILLLACAITNPSLAQGKGQGGGGGGSEPPPPSTADPAIVLNAGVMNADGSGLTSLGIGGTNHVWSPDLDGDGSNGYQGTIAYNRLSSDGSHSSAVWLADVRVINGLPTAVRVREIIGFRGGLPRWSPDLDHETPGYQGYLSFFNPAHQDIDPDDMPERGIWGLWTQWDGNSGDPSTTHGEQYTLIVPQVSGDHFNMAHTWSPGGDRIAFIEFLHENWQNGVFALLVIDDLTQPENQRVVVSNINQWSLPRWSRLGDWVLLSNSSAASSPQAFWLIDPDEISNLMTPVATEGWHAAWSPDDSAIVFHGYHGSGSRTKILKYDFASGTISILAQKNNTNYTNPHWRPF